MRLSLKTAPAEEPLTTAEAKTHLNIDTSDHDTYIDTLVAVARERVERLTNRALIDQTWEYRRDGFPADEIQLPKPPLSSVTSVKYTDTDGNVQTFSSSKYETDVQSAQQSGRLKPVDGESWPDTDPNTYNTVLIEYVAGYGTAGSDIPEQIRHAIRLMVGAMFEAREDVVSGQPLTHIPDGVRALLAPFIVRRFA